MAVRARLTPPRALQTDWPWHRVKSKSLNASLVFRGARRMEAESYLAAGYGTRVSLEGKSAGWARMGAVADIWQPSRLKGTVVSQEFGKPYLSATQVFDVRPFPARFLSLGKIKDPQALEVDGGEILVTRSGNVGRATLAHSVHVGHIVSDDLLRVAAINPDWWGWIYAYLRAPTVREMVKAAQYGHVIKHLETHHLMEVPIIEVGPAIRSHFDQRVKQIIQLRDKAKLLVDAAEKLYEGAIGRAPEQDNGTNGFVTAANAMFERGRRLEGNFHNPTARSAEMAIRANERRIDYVCDLVEEVFVPGRFKHVYGDDGVPYLDSAQILEVAPDVNKRVLSLQGKRQAGYLVDKGTLLVPCSGQLHGIIGSVVLATEWHEGKVLTNHILRIVPKAKPDIRIGYLQMVLGHPGLGRPRVLKGAFGSSVPELSPRDISAISVPRLSTDNEDKIADAMEEAAVLRAQADQIEDQISEEAESYLSSFLTRAG